MSDLFGGGGNTEREHSPGIRAGATVEMLVAASGVKPGARGVVTRDESAGTLWAEFDGRLLELRSTWVEERR